MSTTAPGTRIVVSGLTKRFGSLVAVDDLSFVVEPGRVTGFLGPNGSGKTTTLRMMLGLVTPTSGTAMIGDNRYLDLPDPVRVVGAVLESTGGHVGRTGRDHLRILAAAAGIGDSCLDEALERTGLSSQANRRIGTYSLGMRQRLALAAATIGDPQVLVLDEPTNGLDPEGIRWMRHLLKDLAARGRTVLLSSHLLAEMELLADDLVIVAAGRLVGQGTVSELLRASNDFSTASRSRSADLEEAFLRLTRDGRTRS